MNAKEIKELRLSLHLSQYAFSNVIGVTRSAVIDWELGRTKPQKANEERLEEVRDEAKKSMV